MYTLKADGYLVAQTNADEIAFDSVGNVQARVNCAEKGTVTLLPCNPYKDYIALRCSDITIEQAGREVFRGQAIERQENSAGGVRFSLLGPLSYLRDSLIAPFDYSGSAAGLFNLVLYAHNQQVIAAHKIQTGDIGKTGLGVSMDYHLTNWVSAWTIISGLANTYGGLIRVRVADNGGLKLDWLDDSNHFAKQPVIWGDNLLQLQIQEDTSRVVNSIVAFGRNDLMVLVEDPDSIARYGRIRAKMNFAEETQQALTTAANAALMKVKNAGISISGRAIDRWQDGFEAFCVADFAQAISRVHALNNWVMISELRYDLVNAGPTDVTLGTIPESLTQGPRIETINAWIIGQQGRAPAI